MVDTKAIVSDLAKNLKVDESTLRGRMNEVLTENRVAWEAAGKDEATCTVLAARVAGRQLKSAGERIAKSGCITYEGMFVQVPPYKDWGKIAYNKMQTQLNANGLNDLTQALIRTGKIVYFEAQGAGYTEHYNPSLRGNSFSEGVETQTVSELPKIHVELDSGDAFYTVWNNTTPTFPSGDKNFRFGAPRPTSEKERTCLFLGQQQGSKKIELVTVKASGDESTIQHPTFIPGQIALRPSKNDATRAFVKKGISNFIANDEVANIFGAPPVAYVDGEATGIVPDLLGEKFLSGLDALNDYYEAHNGDDDWWDQWVGLVGEVVHIDPRERGGYTVTVGDIDITSYAPAYDLVVPATQEHLVDFGIGSEIMIVGSCWKTRDGEIRFTSYGWWCVDAIAAVSGQDDDGWDA